MTVVFVADEGVADSGFNATYQAVSLLDSEFLLLLDIFIHPLSLIFLYFPFFRYDLHWLFKNWQQLFTLSLPLLFTLFWLSIIHSCVCLFFKGTCGPSQFACSTGECLQPQWLCDGWNDCSDGADEQGCGNSTYPPFSESMLSLTLI